MYSDQSREMVENTSHDSVSDADNHDGWRSLFLPLGNVIFTSFITLFSPYRRVDATEDRGGSENCSHVNSTSRGAGIPAERSPLFALCGERADTMVCVLDNHDVSFVDMTDSRAGPTEVRRFHGTKDVRDHKKSTATCAALLPLELAHMCRLPKAAIPFPALSTAPESCADFADDLHSRETVFLRGVVGSSDGRVEVFSEHGYVFGFVAHKAPVTAVSAIYGVGSGFGKSPDSAPHPAPGTGTGPGSGSGSGAGAGPGTGTGSGSGAGSGLGSGSGAGAGSGSGFGSGGRSFGAATAELGFITCDADGVLLLWRSEGLALRPRTIVRPSLCSRRAAWCVVQPSSRDWLLGGMGAPRASLFLHTTPCKPLELRMRGVAQLVDVAPRARMPGAKKCTRATAVASDGVVALVARGHKVHRIVLAEGRCDFTFPTPKHIAYMQLAQSGIAVAACAGKSAKIMVLDARRGAVLGSYASSIAGPVRCVALQSSAHLVAIVGGRGDVEVAAMPLAWAEDKEITVEVTDAVPAARALRCLADLQRKEVPPMPLEESAAMQEMLAMSHMAMPERVANFLLCKPTVL